MCVPNISPINCFYVAILFGSLFYKYLFSSVLFVLTHNLGVYIIDYSLLYLIVFRRLHLLRLHAINPQEII